MPKLKPGTIIPTHDEAAAIKAGIAADQDNAELTKQGFDKAMPASQVFAPPSYAALIAMKRPRGRPKATETKVFTGIETPAHRAFFYLRP